MYIEKYPSWLLITVLVTSKCISIYVVYSSFMPWLGKIDSLFASFGNFQLTAECFSLLKGKNSA